MKSALLSAVVAAIVSVIVLAIGGGSGSDQPAEVPGALPAAVVQPEAPVPVFSFTDALPEDVWVNASRQAGSDERTLTDSANSVCYITKIEISGIQGPDDSSSCAVEIDDFTGFWQLIATVEEGGASEIRCNARCLNWEAGGSEQ